MSTPEPDGGPSRSDYRAWRIAIAVAAALLTGWVIAASGLPQALWNAGPFGS